MLPCRLLAENIVSTKIIPPIILQESMKKYPVGTRLEYLVDTNKKFNVKTISNAELLKKNNLQWKTSNKQSLGFGYTSSVYWVRFSVKNPNNKKIDFSLEVDYPLIDSIELYVPKQDKGFEIRKTGDHVPFRQRDLHYRNFVFQLSEMPQSLHTYYIRFETAGSMDIPLWIWSPSVLSKSILNEQLMLGIYYGIIILIILYSFSILLILRVVSYLYYILWIFGFGMYQLAINGLAFQYLWPESIWWSNQCVPFFISFGTVWCLQFGRSFLDTKTTIPVMDRIITVLIFISFIDVILSLVIPYQFIIQISAAVVILMCITMLVSGMLCLYKGYRMARFYVLAWTALLIGVILFALKSFGLLPDNFITVWGQQIGSAIQVTLLSLALADRINIVNFEKNQAQYVALQSQEKYKAIVENLNDIIFTLDEKLKILDVNNAVKDELKIRPEQILGTNFLDLVYFGIGGGAVGKKFVEKQFEQFKSDKKPIVFRIQLKSNVGLEPKEMQVRLEYINIKGRDEILGKVSSILEDTLVKYCITEKQHYTFGNYLYMTEEIAHRLIRNLYKYLDVKQVNHIRIALREVIINAIEHGNLNITYDEKSKALAEDNYFDFFSKRQHDPKYRNKKISLEYEITPYHVIYKITDEGKGFNYKKVLKDLANNANRLMLPHGRGIAMAYNVFDQVKFNKKGNQVLLTKKFRVIKSIL